MNNPVRYVDPSGFDPLDQAWQDEFFGNTGRKPDAVDILIRLFSIAFPDEWDYDKFYNSVGAYDASTVEGLFTNTGSRSWNDMSAALGRLAEWYTSMEEEAFVRDLGTLFGGFLNRFEQPVFGDAIMGRNGNGSTCQPPCRFWARLGPGFMGSNLLDTDADANVHHWALGVMLGYKFGFVKGSILNSGREVQQAYEGKSQVNLADINIGNRGALLGGLLAMDMFYGSDVVNLYTISLTVDMDVTR